MNSLIEANIVEWFQTHSPNIHNVVLLAMNLVERYNQASEQPLSSQGKLRLAIDAMESIVIEASQRKLITGAEAEVLLRYLAYGDDFIVPLVEVAIEVSKHPTVVQLVDEVRTKCCSKRQKRSATQASPRGA